MNYNLFDKHFSKISAATIRKFGSEYNVLLFLQTLCESSNVVIALRKIDDISISPLEIHKVIHSDKNLSKCVNIALNIAGEIAEGILFERAINGYEELTFNREDECIARKRKYCSRSLLEYLKANSIKYQAAKYQALGKSRDREGNKESSGINMDNIGNVFEIESYDEE